MACDLRFPLRLYRVIDLAREGPRHEVAEQSSVPKTAILYFTLNREPLSNVYVTEPAS